MPKQRSAMEFSNFLAAWRKETAEMSKVQAARELGVTLRTYNRIEGGFMHPPEQFQQAFAESLNVPLEKVKEIVVQVPPKSRNQNFWPEGARRSAKIIAKWMGHHTGRDIAYNVQCTPQYLSIMLAGRQIPANELIKRIAKYCGKSPKKLLWIKGLEGFDPSLRDEVLVLEPQIFGEKK